MRPAIYQLMEKVDFLPSGCWQWKGAFYPNGYGSSLLTPKSLEKIGIKADDGQN